MLDESGSLLKAVAKGARKPGSSLAAKMELFSVIEGVFAEGKSLAIVTDVRFADAQRTHMLNMEQAACAAPLAELLCFVAQAGLPHDRLFDLTVAAFSQISAGSARDALAVCTAALLKALAMCGFRPNLGNCTLCGTSFCDDADTLWLSILEGGVICETCDHPADSYRIERLVANWGHALLHMRFAEVVESDLDVGLAFSLLQFEKQWIRVHVGTNLKSLDFLLSSGMF